MAENYKKSGIIYRVSRYILFIISKIFFDIKFVGLENLPQEGDFIIAANHCSNLDPIFAGFLTGYKKKINFLAKQELFFFPLNLWLNRVGVHPVARGKGDFAAVRAAIDILKRKEPLIVFPEGTRSKDGSLSKGQPGIGLIIYKSHSPVAPVYIQGSYQAYPRKAIFPKPYPVLIYASKPLDMSDLFRKEPSRETYQAIVDRILFEIAKLKELAEKASY